MKRVVLVLGLILLALVAFIQSRPATFHVERSTQVSASPATVFAHVNDLHRWETWSPWQKLDPAMKETFDGPDAGVGAGYHWAGNKDIGEGRMTITESTPGEKVGIRLEFIRPFASTNATSFSFVPAEGGTRVTWVMDGPNNFMSKAMGLVKTMDAMIGPDFERGLASLKSVAEADAQPAAAAPAPADSTK
jgi:hypothetical protein